MHKLFRKHFAFYVLFFLFKQIAECAHQTFTFDGRCYTTCPERTFIVPEKISDGTVASKGLSLRKRETNIDEFGSLQDIIGRTDSMKNRAITPSSAQKLCGSCHESCIRCNGPLDNDCIMCDSDYNQIIIGSNISCVRKSNNDTRTLLQSIKSEINGYSKRQIGLISVLIGFSMFISCISIYLLCRKCNFHNASSSEREKSFSGKYSYGPIRQETEEILLSQLTNAPSNDDDDDDSDASEN